jgi:hypothetical protein
MDVDETLDRTLWSLDDACASPTAPPQLRAVGGWILSFVNQPHRDLGRSGIVCPFVPPALKQNLIWLALVSDECVAVDHVCARLRGYMRVYQARAAGVGSPEQAALVLVFPALNETGRGSLVQKIHRRAKPEIVSNGLMLGEFHRESKAPGVHNPDFRPLRSPVPLFVLRRMVINDLVFLAQLADPPDRRIAFVQAYLAHLGPALPAERLSAARAAIALARHELTATSAVVASESDPLLRCPK